MKLTLYHGSNKEFETFEIDPKYSNYKDESGLKEGYGIYLTSDKQLAAGYGRFLYEVQVDSNDVTDFTKPDTVSSVIESIEQSVNISLSNYLDVESLTENVLKGWEPVVKLGEEITKILDNNEPFISKYEELMADEPDSIYESIIDAYMLTIKDVLKYPDNDFDGDIYICHRNPQRLKFNICNHEQ